MSRLEKRVNIGAYDQGVITGISVEHGSGFVHQILGVKQTNNSYVLMANTGYEGSNTFRGCGPRIKTHRILGLLGCWFKELHTQVPAKGLTEAKSADDHLQMDVRKRLNESTWCAHNNRWQNDAVAHC